jgi:hypothetical protein
MTSTRLKVKLLDSVFRQYLSSTVPAVNLVRIKMEDISTSHITECADEVLVNLFQPTFDLLNPVLNERGRIDHLEYQSGEKSHHYKKMFAIWKILDILRTSALLLIMQIGNLGISCASHYFNPPFSSNAYVQSLDIDICFPFRRRTGILLSFYRPLDPWTRK